MGRGKPSTKFEAVETDKGRKMKQKLQAIGTGQPPVDLTLITSGDYLNNWPDDGTTPDNAADAALRDQAIAIGRLYNDPATKIVDYQAACSALAAKLPDGL